MLCRREQSRCFWTLTAALCAVNLIAITDLRAQTPNPDLGQAAKLTAFAGQISVLRHGDVWALNAGDLIQPQEVVVTGPDGYGLFQVADGSTFEVFQKAKFVFRPNRGDWTDLLEVILGKLRVKIEHPGGLPNPNKVRTPSAVISVRGTIFDVDVEDDEGTTMVLSEEGQVEVRHILRASAARVLNPGEYIRVYRNEPLAKAVIDKGGLLQKAIRTAADVYYQIGMGRGTGVGSTTGPGQPADHKGGNPAPPPPPPPPPAPPPPPPAP
jgi:ferric-dicitrate binding protein FerR (iron transport regulator)